MTRNQPYAITTNKEAAVLLAEKLAHLRDSNGQVIGVSADSIAVAADVAEHLNLPFDVRLCRVIRHPGDFNRTIGSVSEDEVFIREDIADIPRNYIYHQIILNRNAIQAQRKRYANNLENASVEGKTVIMVADVLHTPDAVIATLSGLRKEKPKAIIIAAVAGTHEVVAELLLSAEDVVVLNIENIIKGGHSNLRRNRKPGRLSNVSGMRPAQTSVKRDRWL